MLPHFAGFVVLLEFWLKRSGLCGIRGFSHVLACKSEFGHGDLLLARAVSALRTAPQIQADSDDTSRIARVTILIFIEEEQFAVFLENSTLES